MTDRDARLAWRIFNLNWIPIGAMGAILLAAVVLTDFSLEPVAFGVTSAIALVLALVAYSRRFAPSDQARQRLVFMSGAVAQIVQVTAIMGPLSYVAHAAGRPLQDTTLAAFDRAMGFDSRSVILFVNDHPLLSNALSFGYDMIKWPLLAIPIVLASTGRFIRLQQFVMALTIAMAITILISVFAPAIGNYQSLGLTAAEVPNVNIIPFLHLQHDIPQVRNGSLRYLELFKLAGVVAFPSFHAVRSPVRLGLRPGPRLGTGRSGAECADAREHAGAGDRIHRPRQMAVGISRTADGGDGVRGSCGIAGHRAATAVVICAAAWPQQRPLMTTAQRPFLATAAVVMAT